MNRNVDNVTETQVNPKEECKMKKFVIKSIVAALVFVAVVVSALLLNAAAHEVAFFREGAAIVTTLGFVVVGLLKLQK